MADINNYSAETLFTLDKAISISFFLGGAVQALSYRLRHPGEVAPPAANSPQPADIDKYEADTGTQAAQLKALFDPAVKAIISPSALFGMFLQGVKSFGIDDPENIDHNDPAAVIRLSVAWIIAKRVFSIRQPEDALKIINLADQPIEDIRAARFAPIDEEDRQAVIDICSSVTFSEDNGITGRAAQVGRLPAIGSVPNGEVLGWLYRVVSAGPHLRRSSTNRHESIEARREGNEVRFTRTNKQTGSTFTISLAQADKYLKKTSKTFKKLLMFSLQKLAAQNDTPMIGFSLQELVDLGVYSTPSNAIRGIRTFFEQQKQTTISGHLKRGKTEIREEGGVLFYHYKIENGYVKLSVNENFNFDFIANYYTVFPSFAYALSDNAFTLVRYIFFIARQRSESIKDSGHFTINLDTVRENLGLPAPEEVKNRKYKQYIIDPIEAAIEEIEEALNNVQEAKEYSFTITPIIPDSGNIHKWLEGYLDIGLRGDFSEKFIELAKEAEAQRERWQRAKLKEQARLAAIKEAETMK